MHNFHLPDSTDYDRDDAPSGSLRSCAALAALAAGATTMAVWAHSRARRAETEHPALGNFVEVDQVRLHYIDRGSGAPVVLLHGNGVQMEDFLASGLIDALAQQHRVIAFDRPGFGHSQRPRDRLWTPHAQAALLHKALRQLGVDRPVVVGHSWGALVALESGLAFSWDVAGLVLVSGYYYPTARADVALNVPAALPLVGDVMRYTIYPLTYRLLLERSVREMFSPAVVPADFLNVVPREMLVRPTQIRAASEDAAFMIPAVTRLRHHYAALGLPVTLIAGEGDRIVDQESHTVRLHRELSNSELVVVPGAGHMAHHGGTQAIVRAVASMSASGGMPGHSPAVHTTTNARTASVSDKDDYFTARRLR